MNDLQWTDNERWVVEDTTRERFGKKIDIEDATTEMRLNRGSIDLTECPALIWEDENGTHFIIVKVDDSRYKAQFYYRGFQMYGTGVEEYDNIADCATNLLQIQADHHAKESEAGREQKHTFK